MGPEIVPSWSQTSHWRSRCPPCATLDGTTTNPRERASHLSLTGTKSISMEPRLLLHATADGITMSLHHDVASSLRHKKRKSLSDEEEENVTSKVAVEEQRTHATKKGKGVDLVADCCQSILSIINNGIPITFRSIRSD